jgi:hypothetical protein
MAHFAELAENNIVLRVIVVHNNDCLDANGKENEAIGVAFCQKLLGGNWKQTSYNANFRKHYAGIGYTYDAGRDAFIAPQPYPSWSLDADCNWQAPIAMPDDGEIYRWNEETQSWDQMSVRV